METSTSAAPRIIGRYVLHEPIATGGMATVHAGRMTSAVGFSTTVAIKRLHPQLAGDPQFAAMMLDEARVSSRVRHPNVVSTLDVVCEGGELFLVMEYVRGESLATLLRDRSAAEGTASLQRLFCGVMVGVLRGLHAAHEATSEQGEPLGIVHRDVSPQNVLVGADGVPRVLDFGVAKAIGRLQTTRGGQLKGKLAYMAPEQVLARSISRRTDVFAAAVVLWEALSGRRLFTADTDAGVLHQVLHMPLERPTAEEAVGDIVMRALERDPSARFATAMEMADALELASGPVSAREIGAWVGAAAAEALASRAALIARVEARSLEGVPDAGGTPAPAPIAAPAEPASVVTGTSVPVRAESTLRPRSWRPMVLVIGLILGAASVVAISLRGGARGTVGEAAAELPETSTPSSSAEPTPPTVSAAERDDEARAVAPPDPVESAPAPRPSATPSPRPMAGRKGATPAPATSARPFYGRK